MSNTATIKTLKDTAGDVIKEAFHAGMEAGLRRMKAKEDLLRKTIHEIDAEFSILCQSGRYVDGQCERCGEPNPLAAKGK